MVSEKISEKRTELLREVLLDKKRELWNDLKEELFKHKGPEYMKQVEAILDSGEEAFADLVGDTGYQLLEAKRCDIEKIDDALRKLEVDGTYGLCEDCGKEIDEERLNVMSFAIYCIECARKRDISPHPSL